MDAGSAAGGFLIGGKWNAVRPFPGHRARTLWSREEEEEVERTNKSRSLGTCGNLREFGVRQQTEALRQLVWLKVG